MPYADASASWPRPPRTRLVHRALRLRHGCPGRARPPGSPSRPAGRAGRAQPRRQHRPGGHPPPTRPRRWAKGFSRSNSVSRSAGSARVAHSRGVMDACAYLVEIRTGVCGRIQRCCSSEPPPTMPPQGPGRNPPQTFRSGPSGPRRCTPSSQPEARTRQPWSTQSRARPIARRTGRGRPGAPLRPKSTGRPGAVNARHGCEVNLSRISPRPAATNGHHAWEQNVDNISCRATPCSQFAPSTAHNR